MVITIGLVILIAAVVAGVAGVLSDLIHQRESAYAASRLGNGDGDASPRVPAALPPGLERGHRRPLGRGPGPGNTGPRGGHLGV